MSFSWEKFDREIIWDVINNNFGIELNVSEEIRLNMYNNLFKGKVPHNDSIDYFMEDFFGLDCIGLEADYGMHLLGDERFKEYCRRNVGKWREERCLI